MSSESDKKEFHILPHPAKDNNPEQPGEGLNWGKFSGPAGAFHAHGPEIPTQEQIQNLEQPLSKEELKKRAEELNK
ncbi:hypothetical protein DACRYDRAFT_109620 [Dacryopinax primogenitus]|uniref:Uncharacterized protein n=1 Tax=Dacryopinax primogenitus (strain DJM 731) TaxID=1858805 RepID=M5G6Y3_DACPD|nr:uncharacterized protein DACRYDRAFT_109620 [Dacryopinax primogenitus]EJT99517.1 hypothetical protein DACRYDRAFT_109620 [Dacryopinax primogenitus]